MDRILEALRASADPTRLRVLTLLESGELTVSELVSILGQSQPRISRHLKILVDAGLLERFREGSWVFHRQKAGARDADGLAERITALVPVDDPVRVRDRERLAEIERDRARAAEDYFAKFAPEWDRLRQLDVDEEAVATAVRDLLPLGGGERLLDLGTGTGRMLQVLGPDVGEAQGIDRSHEMLAVARANLKRWGLDNCQLRQADILALPLESASVDAVVLHQVLHFLDRPWAALAEAARVVAPGGRVLVADLAPHTMEDLRERHAHRRLGFSDAEVREWLADQGLTCETIRHLDREDGEQGRDQDDGLHVTLWLARKSAALAA